jgi:1-acyl-sn-glycerol-3-phosphate acyltransferase
MPPDTVILVPPETIPKTGSGKLQRSACKQAYLEEKLIRRPLPVKLQLAKLALISAAKKMLGWTAYLGKIVYAVYIAIILSLTLPFAWISVIILPQKIAAKITRFWARNLFRLFFCPIYIEGKENLQNTSPMIFVANHASYIDSLLLIGILPSDIVFTPKSELLDTPIIRSFVKKLGYLTVYRTDFIKSLEDKNLIEKAIQQGRSIVIFPEATFSYATGLRPFKLGAFTIAADTQTPICPIAIQGARSILRGDSFLPKPGIIKITIGKPIVTKGKDWNETIRLHALVRSEIAKHCGEPVIDIIVAEPAKD